MACSDGRSSTLWWTQNSRWQGEEILTPVTIANVVFGKAWTYLLIKLNVSAFCIETGWIVSISFQTALWVVCFTYTSRQKGSNHYVVISSQGNYLLQTDRLHSAWQRRHQSYPVSNIYMFFCITLVYLPATGCVMCVCVRWEANIEWRFSRLWRSLSWEETLKTFVRSEGYTLNFGVWI